MDKRTQIRQLTPREVKYIHARGKLTPMEKVREWEAHNFCPYNDLSKCLEFGDNCNDCRTDLANSKDEWDPMGI
jgi:hypothetical protein